MISELQHWLGMAKGRRSVRHTYELAMSAISLRNVTEEVRLLACDVLQRAGPFINHPIAEAADLQAIEQLFLRLSSEISAIAHAPDETKLTCANGPSRALNLNDLLDPEG
ncbi:hypothetical protein [Pararhizobium arenae]|uniref:hypothetical protein n=1 Tax=Pararhizobium arenae TaxID=1856850 RepID=UPI00094AE1CA|nr:hypothetical protein [Pararhizobium arenae]